MFCMLVIPVCHQCDCLCRGMPPMGQRHHQSVMAITHWPPPQRRRWNLRSSTSTRLTLDSWWSDSRTATDSSSERTFWISPDVYEQICQWWCRGSLGVAWDLWSVGHGFESQPLSLSRVHHWASYLHLCASITKQYKLYQSNVWGVSTHHTMH